MKTETRREVEGSSSRPKEDVRALIANLTDDASVWIRQEAELAKSEISAKISTAGKNAALLVAGAFTLYAGAVVLLLAFSEGLAAIFRSLELGESVSRLLGMLIIGLIVVGAGLAICYRAKEDLTMDELKPERTKDTLKKTKLWAKSKFN